MNRKAIIITAVSLGALGIAVFGGIKAYQNYQSGKTTAKVYYVSSLNNYYENEMTSSGTVTNDMSQDVYPLDEKKIVEVFVEEGQTVSAGDPLLSYDMTMTNLELEMKELDVSTTNSRLEAAKRQLEKLKNTKPIAPRPEVPDEPEPEPEPDPEPEPEPDPEPKQYLTIEDIPPERVGDAYNVISRGAKPNEGKGTAEEPYIYLCTPECYVLGEFINSLSEQEDKDMYVSL